MTKSNSPRGFTIVEMAIVIMILGLLIAAGGKIYTQYQKYSAVEDTKDHILTANAALQNYLETYGRYPCPAPLTVNRNSVSYGREVDCTSAGLNTATPIGGAATIDAQANAYYVVAGRVISYTPQSTGIPTLPAPARIRIGTIPFRNLGLDEKEAYDGYRRRLMYVMTENLGSSDFFEEDAGGITLLNDQDASLTATPGAVHFLVFSYGENQAGAYSYGGARLPCPAAGTEFTNCNISTDSIFKIAEHSTIGTGNVNHNDDVFIFSQGGMPLWQLSATNEDNAHVKNLGKTGIGGTSSETPAEELSVDGVIRAQDDPSTAGEEGNLLSYNLCENGTADCFPSNKIAGQLVQGEGMQCPSGEFMVGIAHNAPVCQDDVTVTCPGNTMMIGFKADGTPDCGVPPAVCPTTIKPLCGSNQTLASGIAGQTRTITAGDSKIQVWQCGNDANWHMTSDTGLCTCTPTSPSTYTTSCAAPSDCGNRFTGIKTVTDAYTCPAGTWSTVSSDTSACICQNTHKDHNVNCWTMAGYTGFNSGVIKLRNEHLCPAATCSGDYILDDTGCKCVPTLTENKAFCPSGFPTPLQQYVISESGFECPGGSTNPGSAFTNRAVSSSHPQSFQNTCQCAPDHDFRNVSCSSLGLGWGGGNYQEERFLTCSGGLNTPGTWSAWTTVSGSIASNCTKPKCYWNLINDSGISNTNSSLPLIDSQCNCDNDTGSPTLCKTATTGGNKASCQCEVR